MMVAVLFCAGVFALVIGLASNEIMLTRKVLEEIRDVLKQGGA